MWSFPRQPRGRLIPFEEYQKDTDWVWNRRDKDERTVLLHRLSSYHAGLFRYYVQDRVSFRISSMSLNRLLLRAFVLAARGARVCGPLVAHHSLQPHLRVQAWSWAVRGDNRQIERQLEARRPGCAKEMWRRKRRRRRSS